MKISGLLNIADDLRSSGFGTEASEVRELVSLAAVMDYNPAAYVDEFSKLLDDSGKDTFSKEEILSTFEEAKSNMKAKGDKTDSDVRSSAYYIATSILSLSNDIVALKDEMQNNPADISAKNRYLSDIAKLAAHMTAFRRMNGQVPGAPNEKDADRVKEILGTGLAAAEAILMDNFNSKHSGVDFASNMMSNFNLIMNNAVETKKYITLLVESVNDRREELSEELSRPADTVELREDPAAKSLFSAIETKRSEMGNIEQSAKSQVLLFNEIAATNPQIATNIIGKLGDAFHFINDLARGERELDRSAV